MRTLKAGIDNYCLYPLDLMPFEMLKWAFDNGAEGVAFSGFPDEKREGFSSSYLHDVKELAADLGLYTEWGCGQHVPFDLSTFARKEIFRSNRKAVEEADTLGAKVVRSCSGGLMRWKREAPSTEYLLNETAAELMKHSSLFQDYGITLAIETHFEFTTFELLRLFDMCDAKPGGWLGICLDTMNLLTMLEEPVEATERILPWIVSTHIKDGGILIKDGVITTFPAPLGSGIINIEEIIRRIASEGREINLSVESHGGSFSLPVNEKWFIEQFPDLKTTEYNMLMDLASGCENKIREEKLRVTPREEWPEIYGERTVSDLKNLKEIRDRILKNNKII